MKVDELIHIDENDKFWELIRKAKIRPVEKKSIIRARWDYLWKKYRPNENHMKARKAMSRREREQQR